MQSYGRYRIVSELGKGAMGVVYKAHDPEIDRMVALKVMRPDRLVSDDLQLRFLKEAKAVGRLSHPGIVMVHDIGRDHGTIFIAMEFLEGKPLSETVRQGPVPFEMLAKVGMEVATALDYGHLKGIVHRDIKPTNIIIQPDGQAKITDFGIAHIEDPLAAQQTQVGEILGTPAYMSPEQVMGRPVDGRSDLFSLGVILYELATGRKPFQGQNMAALFRSITQDDPEAPAALAPLLSNSQSDAIRTCLRKDAGARYQTGAELAQSLRQALAGAPPALSAAAQATGRKPGRMPAGVVAVAGVMLVVGAMGYWLWHRSLAPPFPASIDGSSIMAPAEPAALGRLMVDSQPSGAQVFVDGDLHGHTPLQLDLTLGKHEIRLNLARHFEWEAQLNLEQAGETPLFARLIPMEE